MRYIEIRWMKGRASSKGVILWVFILHLRLGFCLYCFLLTAWWSNCLLSVMFVSVYHSHTGPPIWLFLSFCDWASRVMDRTSSMKECVQVEMLWEHIALIGSGKTALAMMGSTPFFRLGILMGLP